MKKRKPRIALDTIVSSAEELELLGKEWGSCLPSGSVVALFGDLGAGKTTFVRGIAQSIEGIDIQTISSPTFTLFHRYEGARSLYHFDLYRLPHWSEFLNAGFDEYFQSEGICCIEWAEKITPILPETSWRVTLSYLGEDKRHIYIHQL